jgi:hypothetical protein
VGIAVPQSAVRSASREGGDIDGLNSPARDQAPAGDSGIVVGASGSVAREEIRKIGENTRYRAECQITACGFWGNFQLVVGGAAAISAGVAGASAFSKQSVVAGAFAVAASVMSAVLASVKAGERAAAHERAANELNLLSERAFRLYELSADEPPANAASAPPDLVAAFERLVAERDQLVRKAPFANRRLCRLAARFLERGQSYFGGPPPANAHFARRPALLRRIWRTVVRPKPRDA